MVVSQITAIARKLSIPEAVRRSALARAVATARLQGRRARATRNRVAQHALPLKGHRPRQYPSRFGRIVFFRHVSAAVLARDVQCGRAAPGSFAASKLEDMIQERGDLRELFSVPGMLRTLLAVSFRGP